MAFVGENLDFLALLDEVATDTMCQYMSEANGLVPSEMMDRGDTSDMLSICDSTSLLNEGESSVSASAEADDRQHVVPSFFNELRLLEAKEDTDEALLPAAADPAFVAQQSAMARKPQALDSAKSQCVTSAAVQDTMPPLTQDSLSCCPCEKCEPHHLNQRVYSMFASSASGHKLRKRRRWHFSKEQKQQLDAIFRKTMYASKWMLTELSRDLEIPVHTLRNRRWRLRRKLGISGSFRVRGSRTMLPDRESQLLLRDHMSSANPRNRPGALSSSTDNHIDPTVPVTPQKYLAVPPTPQQTSVIDLTTATVKQTACTSMESATVNTASVFNLFSAHQPLLGRAGHGMEGHGWDVPSHLNSNWTLPTSLCWPVASAYPTTSSLAYSSSQWRNFSLPLLAPLYPSAASSQAISQASELMEMSTGSSVAFPLSYAYTPCQKTVLNYPIPQTAYPVYSRSSAVASASHPCCMPSLKIPTWNEPVRGRASPETKKSTDGVKYSECQSAEAFLSEDVQGMTRTSSSEQCSISTSVVNSTGTVNCATQDLHNDGTYLCRRSGDIPCSHPLQGLYPCHLCPPTPMSVHTQPASRSCFQEEQKCMSLNMTTTPSDLTEMTSPNFLFDLPRAVKGMESTVPHQDPVSNEAQAVHTKGEIVFDAKELQDNEDSLIIDITSYEEKLCDAGLSQ